MSRQTVIASIVCVVSIACAIGFAAEKPETTLRISGKTIGIYAVPTGNGPPEIQIEGDGGMCFQSRFVTLERAGEHQDIKLRVSETGPTKEKAFEYGGHVRQSKRLVVRIEAGSHRD